VDPCNAMAVVSDFRTVRGRLRCGVLNTLLTTMIPGDAASKASSEFY
jgi:hypothetical protein